MFCLRPKVIQLLNFNVETMHPFFFYTYVGSIRNYGFEKWGNHIACDIEKIHLEN